jgi:SOS-response transcriptional repressor LexA
MHETRPSKKQRELFTFITNFIKEHGYGPSYREIMRALDYRSVSTVAVHVDGLIARGMLRKTNHSARSLEVVGEEAVKDVVAHVKNQLEGCTKEQLEIIVKSFGILELPEFEAMARKKLAYFE